jgi:hypothetical protein
LAAGADGRAPDTNDVLVVVSTRPPYQVTDAA